MLPGNARFAHEFKGPLQALNVRIAEYLVDCTRLGLSLGAQRPGGSLSCSTDSPTS